jgi:hypothetical protein
MFFLKKGVSLFAMWRDTIAKVFATNVMAI